MLKLRGNVNKTTSSTHKDMVEAAPSTPGPNGFVFAPASLLTKDPPVAGRHLRDGLLGPVGLTAEGTKKRKDERR